MALSDIGVSVRMRDVITIIAATTVNKMRPEERIGKVYSIDVNTQIAKIYMPGETLDTLLEARFARDKIPTVEMITTFEADGYEAEGDIVRIAGGPGWYYIIDYISGIPAVDPSARALVRTNTIILNDSIDVVSGDVGIISGELNTLNTVTLPALDAELTVLNTSTIPALQADLGDATTQIDALTNVTIPAMNTRLTEAQADITTLETVTIPGLNTQLAAANTAITNRVRVIFQTTQPTGLLSTDRVVWYDTDNGNTASYWNGTSWAPYQLSGAAILPGGIVTTHIQLNTLNADRILAGSIVTDKMTINTINGDRITINTLNASKIFAGSITTDRITINTLEGDRITINSLNATKITAYSMTSDRFTADTINGNIISALTLNAAKIVAGSISTDKMTINTINGDRITINTLHADKITANTITSDKIAANSITASQMTLTDLTNYIADGNLSDPDFSNWNPSSNPIRTAGSGTTPAYMSWLTYASGNAHIYNNHWFEVKDGDEFYFTCEVSTPSTNTTPVNVYACIRTVDAARTTTQGWPQVGTTLQPNTAWRTFENTIVIGPATAAYGQWDPFCNSVGGVAGQEIRMRNMTLRRKSNGRLIVDGAILTQHITVGTLNGDRILANSIAATSLNVLAGGGNLLLNSSFENVNSYLTNWGKYDNSAVATIGKTTGRRGGAGAMLTWYQTGAGPIGLYQTVVGGFKANIRYMVSFWAFGRGNAVGATMQIANNAPAVSGWWVNNPGLTGGWQRYVYAYSRTADTTDPLYFGVSTGWGTAGSWKEVTYDDVQLEEGEIVTAYTPKTDEILPGTIVAGMVLAEAINGMSITGVTITGTSTITGANFRTAATGSRLEINSILDWSSISIYNSNNALQHRIIGSNNYLTLYSSGQMILISGPSGMCNLTVQGNVDMNGRPKWSFEAVCQANVNNYTVVGQPNDGQYRMYQVNNNRAWWQYGMAGWYSTEGSLSVGCEIYGNLVQWSDGRDKSNLKSIDSPLADIRKLPVYDYDTRHGGAGGTVKDTDGKPVLDKDGKPKTEPYKLVRKRGVIAQDLQKIAPHLIHDETDDPNTGFGMGVDVYGLLATTIAALRELDQKVTQLEGKNK